ncbi:MAG TPA: tetratricopeptide repeat protein [Pyrinomonadaceae bacterium]|nr:tetratricopeptide repeat protein [Pyrinomonadaceae bacterium]
MTTARVRFVVVRIAVIICALVSACGASASPARAQDAATVGRLERAAEHIRRGELGRAEEELSAVLRTRPREANALNLLGVVRARQKRDAEAEQLFLRATRESPALVGAHVNLATLRLSRGDKDGALRDFTAAAALAPDNPDVNFQLAALLEERREYARALAHLSKIPRELWALEHLHLAVSSHLGAGEKQEAARLFAPVRDDPRLPPDDAASFAALFAAHGETDAALEILEAARRRAPDSFAVLYNLGATHTRRGDLARAEEAFARALSAKPDDAATLSALGRLWRARGDLEKSFAYLERALKLAPDSPALLYDYGWTALNLDRIGEAVNALERLHAARPRESAYVYTLAVARFYNNDDERALALLRRYTELQPSDPRGHYVAGVMLDLMKRTEEARAALARSFELGETAEAAYLLGRIAYDSDDLARAEQWLRRAVALDPRHAPARASLGMTHAKRKEFAAARAELERAVELDPQDLTAAYQLALVYTRTGEAARAREMHAAADRLRAEQRHRPREGLRLAEPPR